jgi:hypothetical protein
MTVGPARRSRHPRSRPSARVADRRGLTAAGGAVLMTLFAAAGAVTDILTGSGLRTVFALCFVAGCAAAALTVHREDLKAVIVMPPLVYAAVALIASVAEGVGGASFLRGQALELANSLVLGAPVLVLGFLVTTVLAVVRMVGARGA